MSGSTGDKTEAPTPKRRRDARKKGQIARAPAFVTWVQMLAASVLLPGVLGAAGWVIAGGFERLRVVDSDTTPLEELGMLGGDVRAAALALVPLLAAMAGIGLVGGLIQTKGLVTPKLLLPKFERISPFKGMKRLVSPPALVELGKVVTIAGVLVLLAYPPIHALSQLLVSTDRPTTLAAVQQIGQVAITITRRMALAGLGVAVVELAIALRRHRKALRMTKQEVKEEMRQSEGDPHTKNRMRSRQLAVSRNRMIADVASAKVVVVNPTHVAVALSYERGQHAPKVVAKGGDHLAARIREEAEKHGVPIVRDVPLARALFGSCELGDSVPVELYEAVAHVLAFVFTLGSRKAFGGILQLQPTLAH